jgi:hypothetical protein
VGSCSCFGFANATLGFTASDDRVAEDVMDALMRPHIYSLVEPMNGPNTSSALIQRSEMPGSRATASGSASTLIDGCASNDRLCTAYLDYIGCPEELRAANIGCGPAADNETAPSIDNFPNVCECGGSFYEL